MYSLRYDLQKDFAGTLKAIRQMGFTEVELPALYGRSGKEMKKLLQQNQLKPTSILWSYQQLRDSLPKIIREAKALGVQFVGCSWIPHGEQLTRAETDKAAALFNRVGAKLKSQQLHFIYHIHGYEFAPASSGETLMD